ncbi:type II toxin-antitoxin system ParD family antitoxin [Lacinutrix chionoecetis]
MNVSLTKKQEAYIAKEIASGDFQNASELVRDALRLHEIYRHKVVVDLRAEIEKGWSSPTTNQTVSEILSEQKKEMGI